MSAASLAVAPAPDLPAVSRVAGQIAEAGLSQAAAAAEIGISGAALSSWLNGRYKGDSAEIARKCGIWIAHRSERAALRARLRPPPEWVETSAAKRVMSALGYAQMQADIAVVHGAAGAGKTTAAERYARERPNAWLVKMNRGTRSLGPCLRAVAQAVRATPEDRSIAGAIDALVSRLRGTGGLLVLDEAQCLALPALDGMRQVQDASGVGLAFVGGEALWQRIGGPRRPAELAQLFSRVGFRVELSDPSEEDAGALLSAWDGLGADARSAAVPIARQPGGLRAVVKAVNWAGVLAEGGQVRREHVASAWRDLSSG